MQVKGWLTGGEFRFFYVDERKANGASGGSTIDGPAHAEFFASLLDADQSVPVLATFVPGKGYVHFPKN